MGDFGYLMCSNCEHPLKRHRRPYLPEEGPFDTHCFIYGCKCMQTYTSEMDRRFMISLDRRLSPNRPVTIIPNYDKYFCSSIARRIVMGKYYK